MSESAIKTTLALQKLASKKRLALLLDPDDDLKLTAELTEKALIEGVDLFLVGGSLISKGNTEETCKLIKDLGAPMVVLFPGNEIQVNKYADGILFMSLISGRNPEFLIGKQVSSAPLVKKLGLETLATGYMLIENGNLTSAHYMSQTLPIPYNKPDIASATALAGTLLGMQYIYMDIGSGANQPISAAMVNRVASSCDCVLFTGGGVKSATDAKTLWEAGSDIVVVGNSVAENPNLIKSLMLACASLNAILEKA